MRGCYPAFIICRKEVVIAFVSYNGHYTTKLGSPEGPASGKIRRSTPVAVIRFAETAISCMAVFFRTEKTLRAGSDALSIRGSDMMPGHRRGQSRASAYAPASYHATVLPYLEACRGVSKGWGVAGVWIAFGAAVGCIGLVFNSKAALAALFLLGRLLTV